MVEITIPHSKHRLIVAGPITGRGVILGYQRLMHEKVEARFSEAEVATIEKLAAIATDLGGLSLTDLQGIAKALRTAYDSER